MQCETFLRVMQISLPSIFYGKKKDRLYFINYFKNISQNFFQFSIEEKKIIVSKKTAIATKDSRSLELF